MKKNKHVTPELDEKSFVAGVAAARAWASPHVDSAYGWAKPRWEKGLQTAGPALHDRYRKAADGVSGGIATVTPKIQDSIDKVGPRISQVFDETGPKIQDVLDKATPALNSVKDKVVDGYLPTLSSKLGEVADSTSRSLSAANVPPVVERAIVKMSGDKKAVKNAQKRLAAAAMQASKDLKKSQKKKSGGAGKVWLIIGIIAAAVTAGVAAWRASKPVEDPWKTPAPIKATPAPVTSQKVQDPKEVVSTIKEAADRATAKSDTGVTVTRTTTAAGPETVAETKDGPEAPKHAADSSDEPKV